MIKDDSMRDIMSAGDKTDNPFLPTFGNKPMVLVGREDILQQLEDGLHRVPGYPTRASMILGQRGMGKTALLLELAERAEKAGFVAARVTANERMNRDILQSIQSHGARFIKKTQRKISGLTTGALGFSFGLTFNEETDRQYGFRVKIELLCDELAKRNKGIFILVDEVLSTSAEMRELASTYQHLVGEGRNVGIAMAGLPQAISSVLNDDVLTFLNRAYRIELGPLNIASIRQFYYQTLRARGKEISPESLLALSEATVGYPFLFQLIGFNLLNYIGDETLVTDDVVRMAIADSREALAAAVYAPVLKSLSDNDMNFLYAMSEDEGVSKLADIQSRLKKPNSQIQPYRLRLIAAGVIASPRRGELEFCVPYFKEYLRGGCTSQ
jgi:hypothetical protein